MVVEEAQDALIFRVTGDRLTLVGGSGRGVGWSGVVDLPLDGEPYASRATKRGLPVQIADTSAPQPSSSPSSSRSRRPSCWQMSSKSFTPFAT